MKQVSHLTQIWIRGRLCAVSGWREPADPSVGIFSESFCIEDIFDISGAARVAWEFFNDDSPAKLTDGELDSIAEAALASQPFDDYTRCVYCWAESAEWEGA